MSSKTLRYIGCEPVNVRLVKNQDKVLVEPGQEVETELNLPKDIFVDVELIDSKIESFDNQISSFEESRDNEIEAIKEDSKAKIEAVKEMYQNRIDEIEEKKSVLENGPKKAKSAKKADASDGELTKAQILEEIKKLEIATDDELKEIAKLNKDDLKAKFEELKAKKADADSNQ